MDYSSCVREPGLIDRTAVCHDTKPVCQGGPRMLQGAKPACNPIRAGISGKNVFKSLAQALTDKYPASGKTASWKMQDSNACCGFLVFFQTLD
jgi:hypothetical protein